jgi:cytochrome c oxidase subunit II
MNSLLHFLLQLRRRRAVESSTRLRQMARGAALLFALTGLAGCGGDHIQSSLHPASPEAAEIARLWWFMFWVCMGVFVAVMGLLFWGIFRPRRQEAAPPGGHMRFIVIGGGIIPAIILLVFLFYSLSVSVAMRAPSQGLTIEVVGHLWWWDVHYPEQAIRTANEIYIPAGQPVRIRLKAADVIHSFWVPNLHGKMDLLPEVWNIFWLRADRPGKFRGQCAEYCGLQHARMAFMVVALPPEEFQAWVEERKASPSMPREQSHLVRGREVFFLAGCQVCHAIEGTEAAGRLGPDLTHIGSRLTLGAGTITNNTGNLAGWIANPQPIKPGNKMPATYIDAQDLHHLVEYLNTLQ